MSKSYLTSSPTDILKKCVTKLIIFSRVRAIFAKFVVENKNQSL